MTATETLSALRAAIKSNPNDLVSRAALADAYEEQGKHKLAQQQRDTITRHKAKQDAQKAEREEKKEELRKYCPKGSTVYGIVRDVSRSGMQRRISFYAIKDNRPIFLDGMIANLLDYKRSNREEGIIVGGCGMDMCFHVVHSLAHSLYQDGYALSADRL